MDIPWKWGGRAPARRQRAFSIFYTGGVGAGALAPVLYGLVSDFATVPTMMTLVAAILLAIFAPGRAFLLLYGVAVAGMFFVWSIILLAHLSFRLRFCCLTNPSPASIH